MKIKPYAVFFLTLIFMPRALLSNPLHISTGQSANITKIEKSTIYENVLKQTENSSIVLPQRLLYNIPKENWEVWVIEGGSSYYLQKTYVFPEGYLLCGARIQFLSYQGVFSDDKAATGLSIVLCLSDNWTNQIRYPLYESSEGY